MIKCSFSDETESISLVVRHLNITLTNLLNNGAKYVKY